MAARVAVKKSEVVERDALPTPSNRARSKRLRETLLAWYDAGHRNLPWRKSRDPYAIWISETMLQQTRVETVIPYYERFLERFPDIETLATADREDVFERWAGLGYYSRARNLHRSAKMMVEDFGASVPDTIEQLRMLPGVGRYTAGAVASIAFDKPEAVVDGNVVRVFSRLATCGDKPTAKVWWSLAGALTENADRPGAVNQALMELGATCCSKQQPGCDRCPLRDHCAAFKHPISSKSCKSARGATFSAAVRPAERLPMMHLRTTRSPTCVPATLAGNHIMRRKQKQKQQQQAIQPEKHPAGQFCIISKQRTTLVNIH